MLTISPKSRGNILILIAEEKLTDQDYQQVLIPRLGGIIKNYKRALILLKLEHGFRGWEPSAFWEDTKFGIKHRKDFSKLALVGRQKWLQWATKIASKMVSAETKIFELDQYSEAVDWTFSDASIAVEAE